jgi:predicted dehydrogenase
MSATFGDVGTHWFDLIQHVSGRRIVEVYGRLQTAVRERIFSQDASSRTLSIALDDSGVVSFELDNGAVGSLVVSQVTAGRKNRLWFEISGSKSSLSWSQESPDQLWLGHRDRPNEVVMRDPRMSPDEVLPPGHPFGWRDAFRRNLRSVYWRIADRSVAARPAVAFATFADGHRGLQLLEAVVGSANQRAPLALDVSQPSGVVASVEQGR